MNMAYFVFDRPILMFGMIPAVFVLYLSWCSAKKIYFINLGEKNHHSIATYNMYFWHKSVNLNNGTSMEHKNYPKIEELSDKEIINEFKNQNFLLMNTTQTDKMKQLLPLQAATWTFKTVVIVNIEKELINKYGSFYAPPPWASSLQKLKSIW